MHMACLNGHLPVVRYLIEERHVDAQHVNQKCAFTPLHVACWAGQLPVVHYLIEKHGVNIHEKSAYGFTPYGVAKGRVIQNLAFARPCQAVMRSSATATGRTATEPGTQQRR